MSAIDNAIARVQDIALLCTYPSTDTTPILRAAPDYPIEDAAALPLSIAHLGGGEAQAADATNLIFKPKILLDAHFPRTSMRYAYQLMDEFVPQFMRRLAGDPTLSGAVDTIIFPVIWSMGSAAWDKVTTQMIRFEITVKTLETPTV